MEKLFPALGVTPPAVPRMATFVRLDKGTLDLGLSAAPADWPMTIAELATINDFQIFAETFENVARVGPYPGPIMVTATGIEA